MARFIVRRLISIPIVLFGMTVLLFGLSQLVPVDPVAAYLGGRQGQTQERREEVANQLREKWGWDKPIWDRYLIYVGGLAQGDLGVSSTSNRPVLDDLALAVPATLELVIATLLIALLLAIPLGVLAAAKRGGRFDRVFQVVSVLTISTPVFWLALVANSVFYRELGWTAGPGRLNLFTKEPPTVTGFITIDSLLAGRLDAFLDGLHHLVFPAGVLGLVVGIYLARIIRQEMGQALDAEYIRTAESKGLARRTILYRHALRNALAPTVTLSGIAFGTLLTGAILVEAIVGWPGLGSYAFLVSSRLDLPAIAGVALAVGLIFLLTNLVVDLMYAALDPRVRLG